MEGKMITVEEQKVYDILDMLEIKYTRYEHKAVYTIEEADQLDIYIPGKLPKNLFLRNRKGDTHYLLIVDGNKHVDLKLLSKQIGSSSLSFASEERLFKYLGLKPGSVTPFGLINDTKRAVIALIDRDLVGTSTISFHPNVNTATISIFHRDFEKFLEWHESKFQYVVIDS
jgi:Ala-tRNA(Pro) deacylase